MGMVPDQRVGIGNGDRETYSAHDRQIHQIVSHIGDLLIVQVQDLPELSVGLQLVVLPLIDVRYPQVLHPGTHHR